MHLKVNDKKNLLIFSGNFPFPLNDGGAIAQFFFLERLTEKFNVFFFTIVSNKTQENDVISLTKEIPHIKVITFRNYSTSSTQNIKSKIKKLGKWTISRIKNMVGKASHKIVKRNDDDFSDSNVVGNPLLTFSKEFINLICDIVKTNKIDIVELDFYESISLLKCFPQEVKKVFVHHEIRTKRLKLAYTIASVSDFYKQYLINCFETIETSFLKYADRIIVFNEDDRQFLKPYNDQIFISPFGIPDKLITKKESDSLYNRLLFIGGEYHTPNKIGIEWFLDLIYIPLYWEIEWPIYIIGEWSQSFKDRYKNYNKVIFTGKVADIIEYYNNSVMVAPILSGSGLRTKVLHALANKVPVMGTSFAFEGLLSNEGDNNHICLFVDKTEFSDRLKEISEKQRDLKLLAEKGFIYYQTNFNANMLLDKRMDALSFM